MMMRAPPEIMLYVAQSIIHPSHIPLVVESETTFMSWRCNSRPSTGFFCHHQCFRIVLKYRLIQVLNKFDGL
ncbi:hypothetical protein D3C78_899610 [compost metagenome]